MDNIIQFIETQLPFLIEHKYWFILLGASLEGPNTAIVAGFLASIGGVNLLGTFFICLAGEVINGYLWYTVGYFAGSKPIDKWGRKDEKSRKIIEKVEGYFKRYSGRAIIFAKLTWSLTIATMIMSGSFKYNLKKFSLYNIIGSAGWVLMTFFVGFFFGESYKLIFDYIKGVVYVLLFLAAAVGLSFLLRVMFKALFVRSILIKEKLRDISEKVKESIDKLLSDGDK